MQAVQSQAFAVASPWPLWAPYEAFASKSYAYAPRSVASGFNARLVGDSKRKPKYDLKCASPGCEFVVKVRAKKMGDAWTTDVNLRHNHEPLDYDQPDELDSEGKQAHDNLTADLQRSRKDLKAKAKDEIVHLRNSADYHSTSTSNREQLGYLSYTSEQELVVWDLAESLDENAARAFEQSMRAARQLADDYPTKSTLDGASHPLAAPPEIRFPGSKLASPQPTSLKESKKPRDKPEKSKRTRKEAPSKSRSKKARVDANETQDIVVTPTGVLSPPTSPYVNGFAAYANGPSSTEALSVLAESAMYDLSPASGLHGSFDGASPLTPKFSTKRVPSVSEDRGDIAVALAPTPLSSSTPVQPQPELSTDAGTVSQEADLTWLTLASNVFAGADGADETSPLVREAAPSPTLPGKAETPAPTAAGDDALGISSEAPPQADQDEAKPAGAAEVANDYATSPRAASPPQQQDEQVEKDLFAGYFAEVGELFDFAARFYDKLLKSGEKAPPLQEMNEQDGLNAFAETVSPATADSHELALKMFERSLALRHSLRG